MKSNEITVNVGTISTHVLGPSTARYALLISSPSQNRVCLSFRLAAILDQCLTLFPGGPPLRICRDEYGDLFDFDLFAIAPLAQQLNVIETLY